MRKKRDMSNHCRLLFYVESVGASLDFESKIFSHRQFRCNTIAICQDKIAYFDPGKNTYVRVRHLSQNSETEISLYLFKVGDISKR